MSATVGRRAPDHVAVASVSTQREAARSDSACGDLVGPGRRCGPLLSAFVRSFLLVLALILVLTLVGNIFVTDHFGMLGTEDSEEISDGDDSPPFGELDDSPALDTNETATLVIEEVNEVRQEHTRDAVVADEEITGVAADHSEDMIRRDFFAHENPDGEGPGDRIFPVVTGCLETGENIAMTWFDTEFETDDGVDRHSSAESVAKGVVSQWLDSPEHRENMLLDEWERTGVGVHVTEDGEVIATQKFCS